MILCATTIITVKTVVAAPIIACTSFKVGLGAKVDINPPSLLISESSNGFYVRGAFVIEGEASDDTRLQSLVVSF